MTTTPELADQLYDAMQGIAGTGKAIHMDSFVQWTGSDPTSIRYALSYITHHPERFDRTYVRVDDGSCYRFAESDTEQRVHARRRMRHDKRRVTGTRRSVKGMRRFTRNRREERLVEKIDTTLEKVEEMFDNLDNLLEAV